MAVSGERFDVLGLGCAAVDDVLFVASYPPRDSKMPVRRKTRRFGGLVGAALVAAARLGARCAYAGQLGTDEFSRSVRENFIHECIDVSRSPCLEVARVIHSTIVVAEDDGGRTIFFEKNGDIGAHATLPDAEYVHRCKALLVDHYGLTGTVRAAQIARSAGIGVVADFEEEHGSGFGELLSLVDHLVLSSEFAMKITSKSSAAAAARALWQPNRAAVIVTCGVEGCWSVSPEMKQPVHHPAFKIKTVDSTGCGDVFHGAYAAALARGDSLVDRIRFASAAAAQKAKQFDIPRRDEVEQLLMSSGRS